MEDSADTYEIMYHTCKYQWSMQIVSNAYKRLLMYSNWQIYITWHLSLQNVLILAKLGPELAKCYNECKPFLWPTKWWLECAQYHWYMQVGIQSL